MLRQLKDFIIRLFIVARVRREERKLMGERMYPAGRRAKVEARTALACWQGNGWEMIHF